jgi:tetratricopeptide (TPR) repeat protein
MPHIKDRRDRVLSWDEVHAEFADAANATPIQEIDRQLEAMGYDLGKVGASVGRLEGLAGPAPAADARAEGPASAAGAGASNRSLTAPLVSAAGALRRNCNAVLSRAWRPKSAAAGAVAGVLVALLVLPMSQSVIERWFAPSTAKVEKAGRSASSLDDRVQALIQSVYFAADPLGFASNLNKAGQLLEAADRSSDAVGRYFEAIAILEDHTDKFKPSPIIATVAHNLARLLQAEHQWDQAERLLLRALDINLMHFDADHPLIARDIASLEALYRARSDCTKPLKTCSI